MKKGRLMVMKTMIAVRSVTKVVVNTMIAEYKFSGREHLFKKLASLANDIKIFEHKFQIKKDIRDPHCSLK